MSGRINDTAKTVSDVLKEQGLAVVLCCVLVGFMLWTNYTQQQREDANLERQCEREDAHLLYQQAQSKELMQVVSSNTSVMQSFTKSSDLNTQAVEALRMEIMKK